MPTCMTQGMGHTWVNGTEKIPIKLQLRKQSVNHNYMVKQPITITLLKKKIKLQLHKAEPNKTGIDCQHTYI